MTALFYKLENSVLPNFGGKVNAVQVKCLSKILVLMLFYCGKKTHTIWNHPLNKILSENTVLISGSTVYSGSLEHLHPPWLKLDAHCRASLHFSHSVHGNQCFIFCFYEFSYFRYFILVKSCNICSLCPYFT